MIVLVKGGSGSGKSEYAENRICSLYNDSQNKIHTTCNDKLKNNHLFYIATMKVWSREEEQKVERHKRLRSGKGFETIEQQVDIEKSFSDRAFSDIVPSDIRVGKKNVLIECMSNLVANEMFRDDVELGKDGAKSGYGPVSEDIVVDKILSGMKGLLSCVTNAVIVTNNVFEDTGDYDDVTKTYISALGRVNSGLASMADEIVEVVAGIPVKLK